MRRNPEQPGNAQDLTGTNFIGGGACRRRSIYFEEQPIKPIVVGAAACLLSWSAHAQQANRISQYADAPGMTPAKLITTGHDIKAGWAGGLWLQKGSEVYFCNSGIARAAD